jgi:hypothetical protein
VHRTVTRLAYCSRRETTGRTASQSPTGSNSHADAILPLHHYTRFDQRGADGDRSSGKHFP